MEYSITFCPTTTFYETCILCDMNIKNNEKENAPSRRLKEELAIYGKPFLTVLPSSHHLIASTIREHSHYKTHWKPTYPPKFPTDLHCP